MKTSSTVAKMAFALAIPLAFAACDDDGMGPPTFGTVSARVGDGAGSSNASSGPQRAEEGSFSGEVGGDARVLVFSEAQGWIELGTASDIDVGMQSENDDEVHSDASIRTDTYTRVQLILQGGSALVEAGADLGGGIVLSADVTLSLGGPDASVIIEKEVTPFTVTTGSSTSIEFDLNSETWVTQATTTGLEVSDAAIQSAATVSVG